MSSDSVPVVDLAAALSLASRTARDVGAVLIERFVDPGSFSIEAKQDGAHNLVTEMDVRAEQMLREALDNTFDATFLGEESGGELDSSGRVWVVDPIDGTVNYAHGIPNWCVSIGLVENGRSILGVIFDPNRNELFTAFKGGGAHCNGNPIAVSSCDQVSDALLVTGFPYNIAENPHAAIDLFAKVVGQGIAVRRFGSAALDLAWLAAGRFDGFWEVALQPWDVAAGILIATEAGGTISSYGAPAKTTANDADIIVDRVLGSNGHLNAELHRLLFDPSG